MLTRFRNFDQRSFRFQAPVVGIAGRNGVGKTNLLDAVYYLCYTKSYFRNKESANVQNGKDGFRLEGKWDTGDATVCIWREGKKTILENDLPYTRVTEHIGKYTAVMIAPDDTELINGGSENRRKFMDGLLSQSEPEYLGHVLSYHRILQQRNACLKQYTAAPPRHDLLDIYDKQLAEHGAFLIEGRSRLARALPAWTREGYAQLSGAGEPVDMLYHPCTDPDSLHRLLQQSRKRDMDLRRTTTGPHTEDWQFTLNREALKIQASQGQKKSFLISLKLAHIQWLQALNKSPVLLLDDIFEKLDHSRLERLFERLRNFTLGQVLLSHTTAADIERNMKLYGERIQLVELS